MLLEPLLADALSASNYVYPQALVKKGRGGRPGPGFPQRAATQTVGRWSHSPGREPGFRGNVDLAIAPPVRTLTGPT